MLQPGCASETESESEIFYKKTAEHIKEYSREGLSVSCGLSTEGSAGHPGLAFEKDEHGLDPGHVSPATASSSRRQGTPRAATDRQNASLGRGDMKQRRTTSGIAGSIGRVPRASSSTSSGSAVHPKAATNSDLKLRMPAVATDDDAASAARWQHTSTARGSGSRAAARSAGEQLPDAAHDGAQYARPSSFASPSRNRIKLSQLSGARIVQG